MISGFEIIRGGLTTQIQDVGRRGYSQIGVTESGPADYLAFYWANKLLANPLICSQLEIANGGIVLRSHIATTIVVTGARNDVLLNGEQLSLWRSVAIRPGDELLIGSPAKGIFNYLAVRGGFQVTPVLNSMSTSAREGLGGLRGDGKRLAVGDQLPAYPSEQRVMLELPVSFRPVYSNSPIRLRLIPGSQYRHYTAADKRALLNSRYQIHPHSNRMGYRLKNSAAVEVANPSILSEPVAYGAVQVPSGEELIVMLNERQTLGGYPKLGVIYTPDCWALAQRKPGISVTLEILRLSCAQNAYRSLLEQIEGVKLHDIAA
ncbi:MAG: biotin-dependent carboxyltransferase family protein [Aestuariibacter sp.]